MKIRKKIAGYLLKIPFVYKSISEEADLSAFWERPAKHIMIKKYRVFIIPKMTRKK